MLHRFCTVAMILELLNTLNDLDTLTDEDSPQNLQQNVSRFLKRKSAHLVLSMSD